VYVHVSRDGMRLHLSSHHDDGTPGTAVLVEVRNIDALHSELRKRGYPFFNPGIAMVRGRQGRCSSLTCLQPDSLLRVRTGQLRLRTRSASAGLSAWESGPSGAFTCPELRSWLSVGDREIPVPTGLMTLMARRCWLGSGRLCRRHNRLPSDLGLSGRTYPKLPRDVREFRAVPTAVACRRSLPLLATQPRSQGTGPRGCLDGPAGA